MLRPIHFESHLLLEPKYELHLQLPAVNILENLEIRIFKNDKQVYLSHYFVYRTQSPFTEAVLCCTHGPRNKESRDPFDIPITDWRLVPHENGDLVGEWHIFLYKKHDMDKIWLEYTQLANEKRLSMQTKT